MRHAHEPLLDFLFQLLSLLLFSVTIFHFVLTQGIPAVITVVSVGWGGLSSYGGSTTL